MAKQIRPLIGLTEVQAQANANYREKVYRTYIENGMTNFTAAAKADKAALRYAGKQHRERAETIVQTELAFAYNRGAHVGVQQAISGGLMGRCEMVWTTAGTNRVCGRCLALKDKVVGYTDESGVTLPPLHPRCRCAIMYREIETARGTRPKSANIIPNATTSSGLLKPKTLQEAKLVADKLNPIVGKHFVRKSKWNGQVEISPRITNCKLPSCAIGILLKDCPDEAILHELVHAHSTSYYLNKLNKGNSALEEAAVQYMTQEIAKMEGVILDGSDYDFWVDALRELNHKLTLYDTDLKFAQRFLRVPLPIRSEWLNWKIRKALVNGTFEQMITATELVDKLTWEALESELSKAGAAN